MKIENEGNKDDRAETIRRIQDYQEQQSALQQQQAQEQLAQAATEGVEDAGAVGEGEAQLDNGSDGGSDGVADSARRAADGQEIQAQIQSQEVQRVNEVSAATGTERSAEAVDTASRQQDRAENWQAFEASPEERVLPPSVEDQAAQNDTDAREEEQRQINMRDLMNQMAIQSGKINS